MSRGDGGGEFCFDPGQRGPLGCLWCHLGCGGGVYSGRALCSKRRPKISKILATHGMAAGLSACFEEGKVIFSFEVTPEILE